MELPKRTRYTRCANCGERMRVKFVGDCVCGSMECKAWHQHQIQEWRALGRAERRDEQAIVKQYCGGTLIKVIIEEQRVSEQTIYNVLRKHGVENRKIKTPRADYSSIKPKVLKMIKAGKRAREIQDALSIPNYVIHSVAKKHGVKVRRIWRRSAIKKY